MLHEGISRRNFLSTALAGGLSFLILHILGCGKKEEKPMETTKPEATEMTEAQKKEFVFNNCVCKKCPSYVECGEKAGYCLVGTSACIKEKKGCTCPECPVTKKMNLKWGYYCTEGTAKSMMKAEQM